MKKKMIALAIWALCLSYLSCFAQSDNDTTLTFGDQAPALSELLWLQGSDPMAVESNKPVYLVYDCWATWCAPCIQSIPHLSELAENYAKKGVAVVSIAVWDKKENVEDFLENNGKNMHYAVAFDKGEDVANRLMKPAKQNSIPSVFVLDANTREILWIGHPMMLDEVLERMLSGTYDAKEEAQRKNFEQTLQQAVEDQDWDAASNAIQKWKEKDPASAIPYELWISIQRNDVKSAITVLNELLLQPITEEQQPNIMGILVLAADRFSELDECKKLIVQCAQKLAASSTNPQLMGLYWYTLNAAGNVSEATVVGQKLLERAKDNRERLVELTKGFMLPEMGTNYFALVAEALNNLPEASAEEAKSAYLPQLLYAAILAQDERVQELTDQLTELGEDDLDIVNEAAWDLMTDKRLSKKYNRAALQLAERAELLSEGTNPSILDTLALAEYRNGHIERAILLEKAAIQLMPEYEALKLQLEMFEDALLQKNLETDSKN